jgi:hypothetical protein
VLALVDEKTMLMVDTIHGRDNLRRRLVNEYVFFDGQFKLSKMDVELSVYLESEGYNVVVVPERLFGGQSIINLADKGTSRSSTFDSLRVKMSKVSSCQIVIF